MFLRKLKKMQAMALAGVLMLSVTACGGGSTSEDEGGSNNVESGSATVKNEVQAVEEGVNVPDDFDSMIYPLSALAMEVYYQGNPYYVQFADDSSRDSFWYSAALTSYYLNKNEGWDTQVSAEEFDVIISALYASYQQGNLEFPDIREGCKYAAYTDDGDGYIFSSSDTDYVIDSLDNYSLTVIDCQESNESYVVTAELKDTASGDLLGSYQYEVIPTENPSEENIFSYSVSAMKDLNADPADNSDSAMMSTQEGDNEVATTGLTGEETTNEEEESDGEEGSSEGEEENAPEETPDDYEEEYNETDPDLNGGGKISQEDALSQAESYYGSSVSCSFLGMESIDGNEYYKFSAEGDGISKPYILVSIYGSDVMAAQKNSDGSWTFDQ